MIVKLNLTGWKCGGGGEQGVVRDLGAGADQHREGGTPGDGHSGRGRAQGDLHCQHSLGPPGGHHQHQVQVHVLTQYDLIEIASVLI